jgi:hypothetical protein
MSGSNKKRIELFEDDIQLSESGEVIHHPLDQLYYHYEEPGREPVNQNYLTFAGDHLTKSNLMGDLKIFHLEFSGEPELDGEAWANPIRAEVLKRLTDEGRSWYISFIGDITQKILLQDERTVSQEFFTYMSKINPEMYIVLDSYKPYGYGKGRKKRIFFEIPNHEIEWVVPNIWLEAWAGYPIEGYNFPSGRIGLLKNWIERPRDALLFKEVTDETYISFFSPSHHRHFAFLTNKFTLPEFTKKINLEELIQIAQTLPIE